MGKTTIPFFIVLLVLLVCSAILLAAEEETVTDKLGQLKEQLIAVQRQMAEMKKQYTAEIDALRNEIRELQAGRAPGVTTEQEELARLQRLAQVEAAREEVVEKPKPETVYRAGG